VQGLVPAAANVGFVLQWCKNRSHRSLLLAETSVALWMLAFKVNFWDDMRLCTPACSSAAVAVSNNACNQLCDPVPDMHYFDADSKCHIQPSGPLPYMDSYTENHMFHEMRV
jgi:hypothetical protein